jgi:hypothetical protein
METFFQIATLAACFAAVPALAWLVAVIGEQFETARAKRTK